VNSAARLVTLGHELVDNPARIGSRRKGSTKKFGTDNIASINCENRHGENPRVPLNRSQNGGAKTLITTYNAP